MPIREMVAAALILAGFFGVMYCLIWFGAYAVARVTGWALAQDEREEAERSG